MTSFRKQRRTSGKPKTTQCTSTRFEPRFVELEDRSVPATFYIDPSLVGSPVDANSQVSFNSGKTGEVTNLRYAATLADWQADNARTAFSDFKVAFQVAEASAGADTIRIAEAAAPIPVDNTFAVDIGGGDLVNSFNVTQPLTLIGSGQTKSILTPTTNTQFNSVDDDVTSVFRVVGAATNLTVQNLTFDGSTKLIGAGFVIRSNSAGLFENVTITNTVFDPNGASSSGAGIVGFNASSLILNSVTVSGYGRSGVVFQDTTGKMTNSTVTGSGKTTDTNNGVEVINNAIVLITGSTITANKGSVLGSDSSGVIVYGDPGTFPQATLIGNSISGNRNGLTLGDGLNATDPSVVNANYNVIANNTTGVFADTATTPVNASFNFWGAASGPQNAPLNPTGTGNPVTKNVTISNFLTQTTPILSATTNSAYLTAITNVGVTIAPAAGQSDPVVSGDVKFSVTFAQPVTGFDINDLTISGTAGGPPTTAIIGSGTSYTVIVSGLSGVGTIGIGVKERATLTAPGFLNTAAPIVSTNFGVPVSPPVVPPSPPVTPPVTPPVVTPAPSLVKVFAVATDAGVPATVAVYNPNGSLRYNVLAFESTYTFGARVAVADVNGDGVEDIIVGAGVGGGPRVRIISGTDGAQIANFFVYASSFTGGVNVAAGDLDGDSKAEVIVGAGAGGGPHVKVVSISNGTGSDLKSFFAFDQNFRGGATIAVGDVDGDKKNDLITAAGPGAGSHVKVLNYSDLSEKFGFFAFAPSFTGGLFISTGDLNADGKDEIVIGAGSGGGPNVTGFDASGNRLFSFFAFQSTYTGGTRVATIDTDSNGTDEVIVVPGAGAGPIVRTFAPLTSTDPILNQFAFDAGFRGGLFVG